MVSGPLASAAGAFLLRTVTARARRCVAPHSLGVPAPHPMPAIGPPAALARLRSLYHDAHRCHAVDNAALLRWARTPEHWAEAQIRHSNWSWFAAEAVVRQCRILLRRATIAADLEAGADPFDPLAPLTDA